MCRGNWINNLKLLGDEAARDETARRVSLSVDETRINFLSELYLRSGKFNEREALDLARVEYAAFVGLQIIYPNESPSKRLALYEGFRKLVDRRG